MSESQSVITIRSEDDAYGLLQKLVDKSINIGDRQLSFEGWPTLTLRLQGQDYQSTITPPVMKAFLELQQGIYRSYATAKYNSPHKRQPAPPPTASLPDGLLPWQSSASHYRP